MHSDSNGIFQTINIDKSTENRYLVEKDIWVKKGDKVQGFSGANTTIGTLVLRFKTERELIKFINNINKWITIQNI